MTVTIDKYHELLVKYLSDSNNLYSINRASPREWLDKAYSNYKKFLIDSIKEKKKVIKRMTIVDATGTKDVNYFDKQFSEEISFVRKVEDCTGNIVDRILAEEVQINFSSQFDKLVGELNQINFDVLSLFLQIHNPQNEALFICKSFDNEFGQLLGVKQKELLIYDEVALKVTHNKKNENYFIEIINGAKEVNDLKMEWNQAFNKIKSQRRQSLFLLSLLERLKQEHKVAFAENRYNEPYKSYFSSNPSIPASVGIDTKES